ATATQPLAEGCPIPRMARRNAAANGDSDQAIRLWTNDALQALANSASSAASEAAAGESLTHPLGVRIAARPAVFAQRGGGVPSRGNAKIPLCSRFPKPQMEP